MALEKVARKEEVLTRKEEVLLVSPLEAGIILSINSGRAVDHRYVKELARKSGEKKRRLEPVRTAGKTFLYRFGDVYKLGEVKARPGAGNRTPRTKREPLREVA